MGASPLRSGPSVTVVVPKRVYMDDAVGVSAESTSSGLLRQRSRNTSASKGTEGAGGNYVDFALSEDEASSWRKARTSG